MLSPSASMTRCPWALASRLSAIEYLDYEHGDNDACFVHKGGNTPVLGSGIKQSLRIVLIREGHTGTAS